MAASAYAALGSITHVLEQLQHPARHRLRFDRSQIETLHEMVLFMLDFFEAHSTAVYDTNEEDVLRDMANCITEAENVIDSYVVDQLSQRSADKSDMGYSSFSEHTERVIQKVKTLDIWRAMVNCISKAEDAIDSHTVDQLSQRYAYKADKGYSSFFRDIESVIRRLKRFRKVFVELQKKKKSNQEQQPRVYLPAAAGPSAQPAPFGKNTMVGSDYQLARIKDRLAGNESRLQVVSIVGMGGIGKTTLAQNIFHDPWFENHFDMRIWVTISQEYTVLNILVGLLGGEEKESSSQDIAQLGQALYQKLYGRRYLIVLDDVWTINVWDELKRYFPDTKKRSRIIVTSRMSSISVSLGKENSYSVDLLDDEKSWELLCVKAFGKVSCPEPKLEKIGRRIASNCKGLPLAIVVTGGLLSKSDVTVEKWEEVAKNVKSIVNSEDDELCLNILCLSYKHLPIHLKPCFLYMRVYPENYKVQVSQLIQSWIGEGFVISKGGKSLEKVAWEYLTDLIDRNLILTNNQFIFGGKMKKTVAIHDLVRDLCIRENRIENIGMAKVKVYVAELMKGREFGDEDFEERNICSLCGQGGVCVRTCFPLLSNFGDTCSKIYHLCDICRMICPHINTLRLVEILRRDRKGFSRVATKLRYLHVRGWDHHHLYWTWLHLFWNLRNIVFYAEDEEPIYLPSEIWNMPQLRHVKFYKATLPESPVTTIDGKDSIILEGLQTLGSLVDFSCSEEILARIPNVKKLKIDHVDRGRDISYFEYHNLTRLHKLESLAITFPFLFPRVMKEFPRSLKKLTLELKKLTLDRKKLTLEHCEISWEDMTIIGSLPNLQVLKLISYDFMGKSWNPVEGEFLQLKKLSIYRSSLETWNAEKEHFPKLESLLLGEMFYLNNFPSGIGEIDTLLSITLVDCASEVIRSAEEVVAEQQETYGNEGLQLHVVRE